MVATVVDDDEGVVGDGALVAFAVRMNRKSQVEELSLYSSLFHVYRLKCN